MQLPFDERRPVEVRSLSCREEHAAENVAMLQDTYIYLQCSAVLVFYLCTNCKSGVSLRAGMKDNEHL